MIPVAQNPQTHEVLFLAFDLFKRVAAAKFAKLSGGNCLAVFFFHLQLDRQAVAIPARHVGRIKARERFAFDDDVLEDLVHRMADVDVAVRIGRAVVQNEFWQSLFRFAYFLIALQFVPAQKHLRFAFGHVAAHRKCGVG